MRRWLNKIVGGSAASASSHEPAEEPGDTLRQGLASHQAGDLDEAENLYREHLASHVDDAQALHLLGVLLAQRGEPAEALGFIERAVALDQDSAPMRVDLGNVRMLLGQSAEAIDAYRAATDLEPANAAGWSNLGSALLAQGDLAGAREACLQGLDKKSPDPETLASLAGTLRACGAREESESACRDALALGPNHLGARQVLGHLLLDRGEFTEALDCFRMIVDSQPGNPFGYTWLGVALDRTGDSDAAIEACSKAVEMAPAEPEVHAGLAGVLWRARRLDEAVNEFRQAVALDPARLESRANLAALLESMSRLEEAASEADAGLAYHPNDAYLNLIAARCVRRAGDREQALRRLEAVDATSAPLDLRAQILYERGQLHDALGDATRAFEAFRDANAVAATSPQAQAVSKTRYLGEIAAAGVIVPRLPAIAESESAPTTQESPVFVVGFPRSGTTLSDQILDSHPRARTLSEKPVVDRIVQRFADIAGGYPAALENVSPDQLAILRAEYHTLAGTYVPLVPGELLVDRYPLNLVRLPAIWRLFPHARIVLAMRHPCDVVLSCYMQHFSLNDAMVSFLDLEDAARLYDAVMSLWRTCVEHLNLDVHVLRYEALVGDFEGEVRALLAFLDLPWDDAVVDFAGHARRRGDINTPSYHQVTRRIYTEARERWRRYPEPLAPVLPLLEPWVDYFGYSLDLDG
jgi:tetratricopeptide (TPR) repeat protein